MPASKRTYGLSRVSAFLILTGMVVPIASMAQTNFQHVYAISPNINGKIAFSNDAQIYSINPDGSGLTRLTFGPGAYDDPAWSPDGTKIAFMCWDFNSPPHVCVMNGADGSGVISLGEGNNPAWSPDGTKIAFSRPTSTVQRPVLLHESFPENIFVMNANGTEVKQLTNATMPSTRFTDADWSPDGTKIAFMCWNPNSPPHICVMNGADGSNVSQLSEGFSPAWSPDGKKIAFDDLEGIFVMNATDGSNAVNLTEGTDIHPFHPFHATWSPDSTRIAFSSIEGIYVMNAVDGTGLARIAHNSGLYRVPDWGTSPLTSTPEKSILVVNSVNNIGRPVDGVWTIIRSEAATVTIANTTTIQSGGEIVKTGYTPLTFVGQTGASYSVSVSNYDGKVFQLWSENRDDDSSSNIASNNNTSNIRTVTLSPTNTVITATYDTGHSQRGFSPLTFNGTEMHIPNLTIKALTPDGGGNSTKILNMWMTIDPQSTNATGTETTYKVHATNGYQNLIFDHWADTGSKDRIRTITITEPTILTAYYRVQ